MLLHAALSSLVCLMHQHDAVQVDLVVTILLHHFHIQASIKTAEEEQLVRSSAPLKKL